MWDRLPEQMATHWGADGVVDGWSGKAAEFAVKAICLLPLGLLFVVIGNYLPKFRQNRTMGIKVKWTLTDEENWNATHRLGGKVWVVGGILLIACMFLPVDMLVGATFLLIFLMVMIPIIYSWQYYKKQAAAGKVPEKAEISLGKGSKWIAVTACIITAISLILAAVLCFTGDLKMQYGDTSFTVEASYWSDLTVEYVAIDSIEYREDCEAGRRTNGFGSPRLSMGTFYNEEFGTYTRYSYTGCDACVVLQTDGKTLVLSGTDADSTKAIYEEILDVWENLSQYR